MLSIMKRIHLKSQDFQYKNYIIDNETYTVEKPRFSI